MSAEIKDFSAYTSSMRKTLLDKIFFMDKIDATVFIDYGCADGSLIHFARTLFPEFEYYGYDISEEMLEEARKKNDGMNNCFFSNWEELNKRINPEKKRAIILSSVIHEVYSYGTTSDVSEFWKRVFGYGWDYIIIRDMVPSKTIERSSNINDITKIYRRADKQTLYDFETAFGSIENNKNLIHYLLKYRYTQNWKREVKENYIPINREELLSSLPENYEITFHEHFILPFLKTRVEKDFGIELKDNTHLKLILMKE